MTHKLPSTNPSTHRPYTGTTDKPWTSEHSELIGIMQAALQELQATLTEADFPPAALYPHSPHYLSNLCRLHISNEPAPGFYYIDYIEGYVKFSTAMLDAIALLETTEQVVRFTQEFLLHETLHVDQGLYSTNWYGVQYAAVVLEQMDYYADAFATSTLITWQSRLHPEVPVQVIAKNCGYICVRGLEIFDQMDYPESMPQITESRLRRYLIWYTQYERLLACRTLEQVINTLYPLIAVELATLFGTLDEYGEKVVTECSADAEYFLAMKGMLVRQGPMPGFSAADLFDAILAYDSEAALDEIRYVVMQYRRLLLPEL
jgi:hypothetical protein